MQDLARFVHIYDELDAHVPDEETHDVLTANVEYLEGRFFALKEFVLTCLARGWTDDDLIAIRKWLQDQGDLTELDNVAIAVINDFLPGAPVPAGVANDTMPLVPTRDTFFIGRL